jgi:hypothetical protein
MRALVLKILKKAIHSPIADLEDLSQTNSQSTAFRSE